MAPDKPVNDSGSAGNSRGRFVGSVRSTREMVAKARGLPFEAWGTLEEAMTASDAAVVMTGDYGGQVYLTVPARLVRCGEQTLRLLLSDLDAMRMMRPAVVELHYERHPVGAGVAGGTGGGRVVDGVWVHPDLPDDVRGQAREVVLGARARLSLERVRELRRLQIIGKQERLEQKQNREWLTAHGLPTTYVPEPPTFSIDDPVGGGL